MSDEKQISPTEPQAISPEEQSPSAPLPDARLRDKRIMPEGVVPKQAQGYVIAGLAVLILMAVMFSKNHAKPAAKDVPSGPLAMSTDVNQRKIQELEQDLSADQRQSQQQAMAQKNMGNDAAPGGAPSPMQPNGAVNGTAAPMAPLPPPAAPPATRSPTRQRRWPSNRAWRRTSSPPMVALRTHRRSLSASGKVPGLALRACRRPFPRRQRLRPLPPASVRRRST